MLASVASSSFENDLERIEILAATPVTNTALLTRNLNYIYEHAAGARFADYDVVSIAKAAPALMYRLFDLRVGLRAKLSHYEMLGLMTPEVTQGFRDVFRVLRYVSDMLGEITTGHPRPARAAICCADLPARQQHACELSVLPERRRAAFPVG